MTTYEEWKKAKKLQAHGSDVKRRERIDEIRAEVKKLHKELKFLKAAKVDRPDVSPEAYAEYIKTEAA